jgi:hypothetical protein
LFDKCRELSDPAPDLFFGFGSPFSFFHQALDPVEEFVNADPFSFRSCPFIVSAHPFTVGPFALAFESGFRFRNHVLQRRNVSL